MSKSLRKSDLNLKNKDVVIANTLTRSAQSLSLAEKRILFSAIAKAGGVTSTVTISAREYAVTYGIPIKQAYEQIKNASENIFERYITFGAKDKKRHLTSHFRWVQGYQYCDGEGYVNLVFSNLVMPYLTDLERQFTKYKLSQACALRSVYSWRMLELIEQQSSGWLLITLDDFHHAMGATETHKKNFKDTRTKIIEPSIKELKDTKEWFIDWEGIKQGRKVHSLRFVFTKKQD